MKITYHKIRSFTMPEIDLTQVLIAIIVLVVPSILRELRSFYQSWMAEQPAIAYNIERAAEFGVKAAQVMKENGVWTDDKGKQAEKHAIAAAQKYLNSLGVKIDAALVADAVKVAWLDFANSPKVFSELD
jgi:hypothetical protein